MYLTKNQLENFSNVYDDVYNATGLAKLQQDHFPRISSRLDFVPTSQDKLWVLQKQIQDAQIQQDKWLFLAKPKINGVVKLLKQGDDMKLADFKDSFEFARRLPLIEQTVLAHNQKGPKEVYYKQMRKLELIEAPNYGIKTLPVIDPATGFPTIEVPNTFLVEDFLREDNEQKEIQRANGRSNIQTYPL